MASGDTSTTAAGSVYLQGGRGVNRGRRRGERGEGGVNTVTPGVYGVRIAAEKILFLSLWDVPGEDSRNIILYLFLENYKQRRYCNHGSQMKQQDRCDG